ncbi:MAG: 2OG-Fe(II) oxygenase [Piscinibacter sp.]|uniref:2OG-Fe(II) oxygenase n=1 Tax=Piscinibacter TaxID=1114981 RepID=UPI000FDE4019|nr:MULTISPECIES: 2OG-Fe(II) oxygenase [Piscinibacter]MCW5664233.1 2OG-Fe(II) oxygenase [Piscinibacter sp.]
MSAAYRLLQPGDPAPWFRQRNTSNPDYAFDSVAGRYILLCFLGSAGQSGGAQRLAFAEAQRALFDDDRLAFFGVSADPQDEAQGRLQERLPGMRHFWDFDRRVSRLYGALPLQPQPAAEEVYRPFWLLLNPNLQVRALLPFANDDSDLPALLELLGTLPPVAGFAGTDLHAPVIQIPAIFEPAFCEQLIGEYRRHGGEVSGFMQEVDGRTVGRHDPRHKVRSDHLVEDEALKREIQQRIRRRVASVIRQVHCFEATRMERYLVACYDAADGGHFRAHRDNTTRGTAHRRFALSINLNDDFEGGELHFPEYGPRRYKPPAGSGVVFSCSLLHAVDPVRRGQRFAFLPFLYDDAAAALREANQAFLAEKDAGYRAGG